MKRQGNILNFLCKIPRTEGSRSLYAVVTFQMIKSPKGISLFSLAMALYPLFLFFLKNFLLPPWSYHSRSVSCFYALPNSLNQI